MQRSFWIEVLVIVAYLQAFAVVRPRIHHKVGRWAFFVLGMLILAFVLLQIAALIYLHFNPIEFNLRF